MRRFYLIWAIVWVFIAVIVIASGTNTETFNRIRYAYKPATEANTIEGYWSKTANVPDSGIYVNYYPTGCAYTFVLNCDSANTSVRSGASYIPAIIDLPLWKHHGVIGSFAFTMVDTGTSGVTWVTTDDSLYVLVKALAIPAPTIYDNAVDSTFMSERSSEILIQTLLDSTELKSPAKVQPGTGGGLKWTAAQHGVIDLSSESVWFERMRIFAMQAGADGGNSKTCRLALRMWLPYSKAYRETPYYAKNQTVK